MKVHLGADTQTGVVHTVSVTPANVSAIGQLPDLLREDDKAVFGDAGDVDNRLKRAARKAGVFWGVALKARPKRRPGANQKRRNRKVSPIRSRVEQIFRMMKCQSLHPVALSRVGEERDSGIHPDRADQPVHEPQSVGGIKAVLRLKRAEKSDRRHHSGKNRSERG